MGQPQQLRQGALTISIDLELLWGVWDVVTPYQLARCAALERSICNRLVALFERYDAPVTWAIVGRLIDKEPGFDGLLGDPQCWYAPDIVDEVRAARIGHDIGSHSHAHINFARAGHEDAASDLGRARSAHDKHGLPFTSFVFPRNQVGQRDALRAAGAAVYRSTDEGVLRWCDDHAPRLRPLANLATKAVPAPAPTVLPIVHHGGLVELPSSLLLMARQGARRMIRAGAMHSKLRRSVALAAERREVFHLWFHPSNFYEDADTQLAVLESGLAEADLLRRRNQLEIRTMASFAPLEAAA